MAVYVDEMRSCVPNAQWRYTQSCHMIADSEEELLHFAVKIGLRNAGAQCKHGFVHFDLTLAMRKKAVAYGAEEIDLRKFVQKVREQQRR